MTIMFVLDTFKDNVLNLSNSEDTILPDCGLFIAVVTPSTKSNIVIIFECFFSKWSIVKFV